MRRRIFAYAFVAAIFSVLNLSVFWIIVPWVISEGWPSLNSIILAKFGVLRENWADDMYVNAEDMEWLNEIIAFVWLNSLRKLVYRRLKRKFAQKMANNTSVKLIAFDIGKKAPKINGVVNHICSDAVIMDLDLNVELLMRLQFFWHTFSFGLRSITLQSIASIQFDGIANNPNPRLFRQLQFTFKQQRLTDYRFDGYAKLFNYLKPFALLIFNSFFVYPNAITIKM